MYAVISKSTLLHEDLDSVKEILENLAPDIAKNMVVVKLDNVLTINQEVSFTATSVNLAFKK